MSRMFREIRQTRREINADEIRWRENLERAQASLTEVISLKPDPEMGPNGKWVKLAMADLDIKKPYEDLTLLEQSNVIKKALDIKKASRVSSVLFGIGGKSLEQIQRESAEIQREVENSFTQKAIMAEEIKATTSEPAVSISTPITHWEFDDSHEKPDERSGEYLIVDLCEDGDYEMRWGANFHDGEEFFVMGKDHVDHIMATEVINPGEEGYYGWDPIRGIRAKVFLFRSLWRMNYGIAEKVITEVFSK